MGKFKIDLNADIGEGFGRWTLGNDRALMPHLTSANIACGYHGGDPHIMRRCVQLAADHGVSVGAHVAFPDLMGFGRRAFDVPPQQLKDWITYQVGALMGFSASAGVKVEHVKPHSALYRLCLDDDDVARTVVEAVRELDQDLILLVSGERVARSAREANLCFAAEALIDLEYDEYGRYVPEWPKCKWSPMRVVERAVSVVEKGCIEMQNGEFMAVKAQSLGIHGEADEAPEIACAVRQGLAAAGISVVPLRQLSLPGS